MSKCYFLCDNSIWNSLNSGPIALSIMVVLLDSYLLNLLKHGIQLDLMFGIAPKIFRMIQINTMPNLEVEKRNITEFLNVPYNQNPQKQNTMEYENYDKELKTRNNVNKQQRTFR